MFSSHTNRTEQIEDVFSKIKLSDVSVVLPSHITPSHTLYYSTLGQQSVSQLINPHGQLNSSLDFS